MVGGGPDFVPGSQHGYPTVIEGKVVDGSLCITVHDCGNNRVVKELAL